MPHLVDLTDLRCRDEVGWFLYHERYGRYEFGGSYDGERLAYSRMLLDQVLRLAERDSERQVDTSEIKHAWGPAVASIMKS